MQNTWHRLRRQALWRRKQRQLLRIGGAAYEVALGFVDEVGAEQFLCVCVLHVFSDRALPESMGRSDDRLDYDLIGGVGA